MNMFFISLLGVVATIFVAAAFTAIKQDSIAHSILPCEGQDRETSHILAMFATVVAATLLVSAAAISVNIDASCGECVLGVLAIMSYVTYRLLQNQYGRDSWET
ncbi:hypothetical protein GX865_01210 [Candidatus Saccharibacteria bacterium]|jgi:hypothetical protein|nr:hypothetical protein [Candidatus Saccharibacteria bacterium]